MQRASWWLALAAEATAQTDGVLAPLRKILNGDERINNFFFSDHRLAKEYPKEMALADPRVNGDEGIDEDFDFDSWKLMVNPVANNTNEDKMLSLALNDLRALPKQDLIFDFKCIEGWDMITHWGGTRLSDFLAHYKLGTKSGQAPDAAHPEDLYKYVGLMTPDGVYYVGVDMKSMMHPQTLLAYEMNEQPLTVKHGFPLRLIIPVKYGVKNLKCISSIWFSDNRPPDYWYERGYDYDCAL